ncbi:hypothetical protein ACHAXS_005743 [Conticribra weissflogii]
MTSKTTQKSAPPSLPPPPPLSPPRPRPLHNSSETKSKNVVEIHQCANSPRSGSSPPVSPKPTNPLQIQPQRLHASNSSSIESSSAAITLKKNNRLLKTTIDALIKRITKLEHDNRVFIGKSENWSLERRILYERLETLEEMKKSFKREEMEWIEERAVWKEKQANGARVKIQGEISSNDPSFASPPVPSRQSESIDQRDYAWRPQSVVPKGIRKSAHVNGKGGGSSSLESSFVYFDRYQARCASLVSSAVHDSEEQSILEDDDDYETTSSHDSDTSSSSSASSSSSLSSDSNKMNKDGRARDATENLRASPDECVFFETKQVCNQKVPNSSSFSSRASSSNIPRTKFLYKNYAKKEELSFPLGHGKQNCYVEEEKNQMIAMGQDLMTSRSCIGFEDDRNRDVSAKGIENPTLGGHAARNQGEQDQQQPKSNRVFDILNTMTMVLTKKALATALNELTSTLDQDVSFQFFFLLSKNLLLAKEQLEAVSRGGGKKKHIGAKSQFCNWGTRFLDPFTFTHADCMDKFPSKLGNASLDPSVFSQFCCPEGIKVQIFPRVGMEGAKMDREWLKKIVPQYKVLAFTDDHGEAIHGVAITVLEELVTITREAKFFQWSLL